MAAEAGLPRRLWRWLTATTGRRALLGVLAAILLAMAFLDRWALESFRDRGPTLDTALRLATLIGDSGWMLGVTALVALYALHAGRGSRSALYRRGLATVTQAAAVAFLAVGVTGALAALLKLAIGRPRPKLADTAGLFGFDPLAFDFKMNSFPSGHATTLFALAAILVLLAPRWRVAILVLAGAGALTRVGVGAHHVSDVIAGSAFGFAGGRAIAQAAAARGWGFDAALRPKAPRAAAAALRRMGRQARREGQQALRWTRDRTDGLIAALRRRGADEERGR